MRAELVYNQNNEPRVLLYVETSEERKLLKDSPDLSCIRTGAEDGQLKDLAYAICEEQSNDDTEV